MKWTVTTGSLIVMLDPQVTPGVLSNYLCNTWREISAGFSSGSGNIEFLSKRGLFLHWGWTSTVPFRSVMVHVFRPNIFGTGLSVRCACVPSKYSIVLTTARVEINWKLSVQYIITFGRKQSLIFQIVPFFQEIQTINAVLALFDVTRQIAV